MADVNEHDWTLKHAGLKLKGGHKCGWKVESTAEGPTDFHSTAELKTEPACYQTGLTCQAC